MTVSPDRSAQPVFGRRPFFRLQPCAPGFAASSRFGFRNVAVFAAPCEVVFDTIADGDKEAEWFPSFQRLEWLTTAPHGEGAQRDYEIPRIRVRELFTAWKRGELLEFEFSAISLPIVTQLQERYEIAPVSSSSSRLIWQVGYEPGLLFRPVHGVLHRHFAADFRKAVEALGRMLGLDAPIETENRGPRGVWAVD
ncbi:MAG: SRPBCC family protein [Deltaproteobacteria bacterium]|nr:SRPBCC family protein [Deltaproteobacteria bacterium]